MIDIETDLMDDACGFTKSSLHSKWPKHLIKPDGSYTRTKAANYKLKFKIDHRNLTCLSSALKTCQPVRNTTDPITFETPWMPLNPSDFWSHSASHSYGRSAVVAITLQDTPRAFIPRTVWDSMFELMARVGHLFEQERRLIDVPWLLCLTKQISEQQRVTKTELVVWPDILMPCAITASQEHNVDVAIDTHPISMESFVASITTERTYKLTLQLSTLFSTLSRTGVLTGTVFVHCVKIDTR